MTIVFDEVVGSVEGERGAEPQQEAHGEAMGGSASLQVRVDEMERQFRIREERKARLLAD